MSQCSVCKQTVGRVGSWQFKDVNESCCLITGLHHFLSPIECSCSLVLCCVKHCQYHVVPPSPYPIQPHLLQAIDLLKSYVFLNLGVVKIEWAVIQHFSEVCMMKLNPTP